MFFRNLQEMRLLKGKASEENMWCEIVASLNCSLHTESVSAYTGKLCIRIYTIKMISLGLSVEDYL